MKHLFPTCWQEQLTDQGITQFTPIQEKSFDPIFSGQSFLGISPTGTGKTLAYLWPTLLRLTPKKSQQLMILAPNTELAGQIFDVCKTWAEPLQLTAQLFLSGSSQKRQIERLKKGPEILIGTPGRMLELMKVKKIKMMSVDTIILDEFDELFSESQYHFVKRIIHYVPKEQQLIYMSATSAFDTEKLASEVVQVDLTNQTLTTIEHTYLMVDKRLRLELLRKFSNIPDCRALVFFNSLSDLGASEEKLLYHQVNAVSLASDVNVKLRKVILEKFKESQLSLLLATDLVARGMDIPDLECVINFDLPYDKETYIHRSGRTGRMGKDGLVITLVSNQQELKQLKKYASVSEIELKNQQLYKV